MKNDYLMPDLQSFKMVLETMGGKYYDIIRQEVYDFNEFGRAVPIRTMQKIFGVLNKGNMSLDMNADGDRISVEYTFTIVFPDVLYPGDIIINDSGERLRVLTQTAVAQRGGVSDYSLVREGTYEKIKNREYMEDK